jgi:hypothetical protein
MTPQILAAIAWSPGFKGLLTVAVAVIILCGSTFLILSTNSGPRLGFQLALTGLMGWLFVMGAIWAIYGIGYKGPAPTWKVVDTVSGDPAESRVDVAEKLVLPDKLDDPVKVRDASEALLKAYPPEQKDPTLGDLVTIDTKLKDRINKRVEPWKILETSNKYTGETQSVVAEALGPEGENKFPSAASYVVVNTYLTGGKKGLGEDRSIIKRIAYKFTSALELNSKPFYAVVQLQEVIPQETKAGQAPPLPVANPDAAVYSVVLERDRGALRLPSIGFTIFCGVAFAFLASSLHRRDRLVLAQRAATAPAGAA